MRLKYHRFNFVFIPPPENLPDPEYGSTATLIRNDIDFLGATFRRCGEHFVRFNVLLVAL
jgi:hypothetical protein